MLRMQSRHQATSTQPLPCDIEILSSKTPWNYMQWLQNRISAPTQTKKHDFEALFQRNFDWKITSGQITIAALMRPLQYDLQCPAAKDNSITHAAAATSNAAVTMRFAASRGKPACIYAHGNRA